MTQILIVDDEEKLRHLLSMMLERKGMKTHKAIHGANALEMLENNSYDLIISDIKMPVMDGYDATVHIRQREKASGKGRVPIVAVTSYAMPGDREHCLEAGCNGYIEKPINPETFAGQVEAYLEPGP